MSNSAIGFAAAMDLGELMRACWVLTAMALGTGGGCQLYTRATHNLFNETVTSIDRCRHRHRVRDWAEEVWDSVASQCPEIARDDDFRDGFIDGYTDFLLYGGDGHPPPIPPSNYRRSQDLSPEGLAAIESWNAGFFHGAGIAREHSRNREWLTVPVQGGFGRAFPDHAPLSPPPRAVEPLPMPAEVGPEIGASR